MTNSITFRWRKTTDINREYAVFELLRNEIPVMDLGYSDGDILEVGFNPSITGKLIEFDQLSSLLAEGKANADLDRQ